MNESSSAPSTPLSLDEFPPSTAADWRAVAEAFLKGAPFEKKLVTRTHEGLAVQPIHFAEDTTGLPLAWPGQVPFTRGASATGMMPLLAQEIPAEDAKTFNRQLLEDLMSGQTATLLVPENGREERAPGKSPGLRLSALADLREALTGVDLEAAPVLVWTGADGVPLLALLGALADERGGTPLAGAILADPLTRLARRGNLPGTLENSYDEMALMVRWGIATHPSLRLVGVEAGVWADAGASAVQELAYGLATAVAYLRELNQRGLAVNEVADRIGFGFSLGSQVFMEIAKLRAARRLWSTVVEAFGGQPVPAWIHGRTSSFNKSSLDPHTNLLRTTGEVFAGLCGGLQSLQVGTFDASVRVPDGFSRRIARNIPIILAEECGLIDVADPAGGSWSVETLTDDLAAAAWQLFQEIEAAGGMANALRAGLPQAAVATTVEKRLFAMATCRDAMVGVNLSANPAEKPLEKSSAGTVSENDPRREKYELCKVVDIPSAIVAYRNGCTVGQVQKALRGDTPVGETVDQIAPHTVAEAFESLRAEAHTKSAGNQPLEAWLANFGPLRQHRLRAEFSAGFLACGGILSRQEAGAQDVDSAVAAALEAQVPVVVICSSDDTYPEIVPAFAQRLKSVRPDVFLLLAGAPGDKEHDFRAAGVDDFIHLRANRVSVLENLLAHLPAAS